MLPTNISEAMSLAGMLAKSAMVPSAYRNKPEDIFVAISWGAEVGLGPLQALNGISIINGRPALWGDAAIALVRGHPACEGIREGVEGEGDAMVGFCEVKRQGQPVERRTFSVADAKKAGLWNKQGPWQQYPQRMLQLRARGFAIRDVFPDALRGIVTDAEAEDMPAVKEVPNMAPPEPGTHAHTMAQLQAPDDEELPILSPMGELKGVRGSGDRPAIVVWLAAVRKAVKTLESAEALREWRSAMGPHFAGMSETYPDEVTAAENLCDARREHFLALAADEVAE